MRWFFVTIAVSIFFIPHASALGAEGSLFLAPASGWYDVEEAFQVRLFADTGDTEIIAAEADIQYDPSALQAIGISTTESALDLWPAVPEFSNLKGNVTLSGWTSEGISGRNEQLVVMTFRTKRPGEHTVRIVSGALLASDGKGSNIVTSLRPATYTVLVSESEPVQNETPQPRIIDSPVEEEIQPVVVPQVLGVSTQREDTLPKKPNLIDYPTELRTGDRVVVRGSASPNARIVVWTSREGGVKEQGSTNTGSDGSFAYISEYSLKTGVYELWAESYNNRGILGPPSEKIEFTVKSGNTELVASVLSSFQLPSTTNLLLIFGFILGFVAYRVARRFV